MCEAVARFLHVTAAAAWRRFICVSVTVVVTQAYWKAATVLWRENNSTKSLHLKSRTLEYQHRQTIIMALSHSVDVLILGGGPAGLTAALTLARQLHSVVVFDSGSYRNKAATHIHTVLTWDHKNPEEFRAAARENILSGYETVQFHDTTVEKLEKTDEGSFKATDKDGAVWTGKKVVLATGVTDIYPEIKGYDDCWVKGM